MSGNNEDEDLFLGQSLQKILERIESLPASQKEEFIEYRKIYSIRKSLFMALSWPIKE